MALENTKETYGSVQILLHWTMALIIIGLLIVGIYMVNLPVGLQKIKLYGIHKELGILILVMAFLRVAWRLSHLVPELPLHMPGWQKFLAKTTHLFLYVWMFAMPLTGWMSSSAYGFPVSFFGLFILPDLVSPHEDLAKVLTEIHHLLGFSFIALIGLHTSAAFYHLIIYKDNIFNRMLFWK